MERRAADKNKHTGARVDMTPFGGGLGDRRMPRVYLRGLRIQAVIWTVVVAAIAAGVAANAGHLGAPLMVTACAFAVVTLPYFLYGISSVRHDIIRFVGVSSSKVALLCIVAPIVIYLFYAFSTRCFTWSAFAILASFVCLPTGLILLAGSGARRFIWRWQDLAAVFLIWVPFDTGLLNSIWAWPEGEGAYIINTSLAVSLALTLFSIWRRLPGLSFRWSWNWGDVSWAILGFGGFALIALPFGFLTDFLTFNPTSDWMKILAAPLGIFFFIAVPEELLFRGLVQNLLGHVLRKRWLSLFFSGLFFGATHLNNDPVGDWRFFVLATIAGWFYGLVYMRTRSLLAPVLTHTAVDVVWLLLLHV